MVADLSSGGRARNVPRRLGLEKWPVGTGAGRFRILYVPGVPWLVDVEQAFLEFGGLLTGYRPIHGSLNFLDRMLTVPVDKWSCVKLLTGMLQDVLDNGT